MTSFESYFKSLKKAIKKNDVYDIWPDFEPNYDRREYAWTDLRGLGEALLLNCSQCDGPSDMRHKRCKSCVDVRNTFILHLHWTNDGNKYDIFGNEQSKVVDT